MKLTGVVVEAHSQVQVVAVRLAQPQQLAAACRPHQRLHGVGQHQHLEASLQTLLQHHEDVRVHEGLASGETDLVSSQVQPGELVKIVLHLGGRQVGQPVVRRARLDVAVRHSMLHSVPVLNHSVSRFRSSTKARSAPVAVTFG